MVAVGDIACDPTSPMVNSPGYCQERAVAKLVAHEVKQGAQWFLPLGDIQYETGSLAAFQQVYDKWFGRFRSITEPVPGNHEYYTQGAAGYFAYFGNRAGTPDKPWQTFVPVKGWRVLLLDSNCDYVGGCGPDSPQGRWVSKTLARSKQDCAIATWHHPLHSSGGYGGDPATIAMAQPLWDLVDAGGVDIVLNGHEHIYERFAPIDKMRQFTVGTGGKELYDIKSPAAHSQVRMNDQYGVLRLTLSSDSTYRYAFIDVGGKVLDQGTGTCENKRHM
jgi:hypothetical protein